MPSNRISAFDTIQHVGFSPRVFRLFNVVHFRRPSAGIGVRRSALYSVLIVGVAVLLWGVLTLGSLRKERDLALLEFLSRPLRLQASRAIDFHEFLLALRIYKYRAGLVSHASFADVFYDTPNFALSRNGYSYRFRRRLEGGHTAEYSLRFEREWWAAGSDESGDWDKIDVHTQLAPEVGEAILGGAWAKAVAPGDGLKAPRQLAAVLEVLGIDRRTVAPQLEADLEHDRYDLTDKGRAWFELDRERWRFRRFGEAAGEIALEDFVVDTCLNERDPELLRRLQSMLRLAQSVPPIMRVEATPRERAIERLSAL